MELPEGAMPLEWERQYPGLPKCGISSSAVSNGDFLKTAAWGHRVLIMDRCPRAFVAAFLTATERGCVVFLANADWGLSRMELLLRMARPHFVTGSLPEGAPTPPPVPIPQAPVRGTQPGIMIATGGSSGGMRLAIHTWDTLRIAAEGFWAYFGREPLNFCCMLPLHHVSGLMQVMRALISGGELSFHDYSLLAVGRLPQGDPVDTLTSLVPTQLKQLLQNSAAIGWLRRLRAILLGGGPASEELLETARGLGLPLSPCYGMTETAAAVTLLHPDKFLGGGRGVGPPLPHACISVRDSRGLLAQHLRRGRIFVKTKALFKGYFPDKTESAAEGYSSSDQGHFDDGGSLHIAGRLDQVINSGGELINPLLVQRTIRETGLVSEVVVVGVPDPKWGECVAAIYISMDDFKEVTAEHLRAALEERLAPHEIPKRWIAVAEIPRDALGKLDRSAIGL